MCGGVTAYVACKRSQVKPGQWLVLPGAGGGLGHVSVFLGGVYLDDDWTDGFR